MKTPTPTLRLLKKTTALLLVELPLFNQCQICLVRSFISDRRTWNNVSFHLDRATTRAALLCSRGDKTTATPPPPLPEKLKLPHCCTLTDTLETPHLDLLQIRYHIIVKLTSSKRHLVMLNARGERPVLTALDIETGKIVTSTIEEFDPKQGFGMSKDGHTLACYSISPGSAQDQVQVVNVLNVSIFDLQGFIKSRGDGVQPTLLFEVECPFPRGVKVYFALHFSPDGKFFVVLLASPERPEISYVSVWSIESKSQVAVLTSDDTDDWYRRVCFCNKDDDDSVLLLMDGRGTFYSWDWSQGNTDAGDEDLQAHPFSLGLFHARHPELEIQGLDIKFDIGVLTVKNKKNPEEGDQIVLFKPSSSEECSFYFDPGLLVQKVIHNYQWFPCGKFLVLLVGDLPCNDDNVNGGSSPNSSYFEVFRIFHDSSMAGGGELRLSKAEESQSSCSSDFEVKLIQLANETLRSQPSTESVVKLFSILSNGRSIALQLGDGSTTVVSL